jgi:hypothetical protein
MNLRDILNFGCRALALAGVTVLTACSSPSAGWQKAGVSDQQRQADYSVCRAQMRAATDKDYAIDQDISASRSNDWRNAGQLNAQRDNLTSGDADYSRRVLGACMTAKGYQPR